MPCNGYGQTLANMAATPSGSSSSGISEFDQLNLAGTTGELFVELCKRDGGRCPRLVQLKYHNHSSEVSHFNSQDDYLGSEIIEWANDGFGANRRP